MSMIGKSLSHYQITSLIGKGGMGEVYQATDKKLGREVAIKVMPEEFARDADRVARFQREAKLLASLNHPNIAAIYGLEESDSTNFLVMELVEGKTLDERIKSGRIPVEEALKLTLQIAEALEAAHEKGVIHRDLKPANIKVTPDGKVKVLDFGLAKAFAGEQADFNLSNSPTLSNMATQQGVILGTAAYMSPEQASGKTIDKKADIWAFGVVLFEMLAGRSLFAGENVSQTLARVLERQPDYSTLPANLHPKIIEMLERCLEKDTKNRYHDIADVRVDIQKVLTDPRGVFVQPVSMGEPRTRMRSILLWIVVNILIGIIAGVAVWYLKPTEQPQVFCFNYELPEGLQSSDVSGLAISPDGKKFILGTTEGFYSRSLDEMKARLLFETDEKPESLFFSPDGQWIGYWSSSELKLKKMAISGDETIVLCDAQQVISARWCADDTILYSQIGVGIMRVSAKGGTPKPLVKPDTTGGQEGKWLAFPQILPDGETLLYTSLIGPNFLKPMIMLQSLESGEPTELFNGVMAEYLPTGHIVYLFEDSLFAVPFDLDSLTVTGDPVSMLEGISGFFLSGSGTLAYSSSTEIGTESNSIEEPVRTLVWVDRNGGEEFIQAPSHHYTRPKISPDGTKIALSVLIKGNADIHVIELAQPDYLKRLTWDEGADLTSIWTLDGKKIAFCSMREAARLKGGIGSIFWKAEDGTGEVEHLGSAPGKLLIPFSWSKDGKTLVSGEIGIDMSSFCIKLLSMEDDHELKLLLDKGFTPQISPDGRWMACVFDADGQDQIYQNEVFVFPFPEINKGQWQISTDGGNSPLWSPKGSELFYLKDDAVMAVAVETEPTFKPGKPETLFSGTYVRDEPVPWDIHPNGDRFLMMKESETIEEESTIGEVAEEEAIEAEPPKLNIIVNWFEKLKERVPVN